jgi:hypothetical protein
LGLEEEVEHAGREEDLEVVGLEETSEGGQDSEEEDEEEVEGHEEEEGHEEGAGLEDEGVGGDGLAAGSASTHRFRRSHLVRPPIAPRDDNKVVIVPCGDE